MKIHYECHKLFLVYQVFLDIGLLVEWRLLSSKSEARRMIENRGVKINGNKVEDTRLQVPITDELIIQVGKRKFVKIKTL